MNTAAVTILPAKRKTIYLKSITVVMLAGIALVLLYISVPPMSDWTTSFRPAALAMLHGQNPYDLPNFHNAPWVLVPLIPIAILPDQLGRTCLFVISFAGCLYLLHKLKASPWSMILFMSSSPILNMFYYGELDWVAMFSFITTPIPALLFAAIKPQIGFGIGLYWLILAWRQGKSRLVLKWFAPVFFLLGLSFYMYGFWVMSFSTRLTDRVNISIFPYLIPVGLYLLYTRAKNGAMASGVLFAPYHSGIALCAPLVSLLQHPRLLLVAWILTWIPQLMLRMHP